MDFAQIPASNANRISETTDKAIVVLFLCRINASLSGRFFNLDAQYSDDNQEKSLDGQEKHCTGEGRDVI